MTANVTVNGSIHGTISFLAQECLLQNRKTDFESDIWSLGIRVTEFITLSVAWDDVFASESQKSELEKLKCAMAAKQLPKICFKVPLKWKLLVEGCLKFTPAERPKAKDLALLTF